MMRIDKYLAEMGQGTRSEIKKLIRRIRQQGVNYLVFLADEQQDAKIQRNGFEKIGKVGGYSVYKDKW